MIKELVTGLFDQLVGQKRVSDMNRFYQKQMKLNKEFYDKQMNDATSLFNRIYYRDYVNTPQAQDMLKQVRKQLDKQSKALRNTSTVMGYTPEAMAAQQKNNNQILDDVVSRLSAADAQHKNQALNSYENMRSKMQEYLHNASMGLAANQFSKTQDVLDKNFLLSHQSLVELLQNEKKDFEYSHQNIL